MADKLRLATPADADTLALLNEPVQQLHARLFPDKFKAAPEREEVAAFFRDLLGSVGHRIGLYEDDGGAPLGYVWFERREPSETPFTRRGRSLHVHHICVVETARRQGVASALMEWVEGHAGGGIAEITLDYWTANEAAQAFFLHRGFGPVRMTMGKPVQTH